MKKKWLYIVSIVLSSAMLITGIVFLFVMNYNMDLPEPVEIFTSNSSTYVKTTLNNNDYGYIYKFDNENGEVIYPSKANMLNLDILIEEEVISLGEEYKISVCYKNEYENGYSKFSKPVSWLASKFLSAPELKMNSEYIYWNAVENADYYEVIYTCGSEDKVHTTIDTSVLLSRLAGGKHYFSVVAKSYQDRYLASEHSNSLYAETYHVVEEFSSAIFDKNSKILTIWSADDVDKVRVWMGVDEFNSTYFDFSYSGREFFKKVQTGSGYQIEIDLQLVYSTEKTYISVEPLVSGYNIFNGNATNVTIQ